MIFYITLILARLLLCLFFFFNDTATTEIYTLSLHDALPISPPDCRPADHPPRPPGSRARSEEHTSELQSRRDLVCRLLLEKKKKQNNPTGPTTRTRNQCSRTTARTAK